MGMLFSAAVLDRLNTCLESNGTLILSERGDSAQSINAHPDFRFVVPLSKLLLFIILGLRFSYVRELFAVYFYEKTFRQFVLNKNL